MYTIVGATGKVGSKVAMILLRMGENVRMIGRNEERLKPFVAQGAMPFVGDATDTEFLTRAFSGSDAVFLMIPPYFGALDFSAYQNAIGQSITTAVQQAKIRYVVNLSSVGAELPEGTGPISGLHRQEERLNRIPGLNLLHVRAGYFMENLLMNIPLIRSSGIMGSAIQGDLRIPMIATTDIAEEAAERLLNRDFSGTSIQYLLGQRDVSLEEATAIIGRRIGRPDLKYVQFSYEEAKKGMVEAGLSPDVARNYIEMSKAFNEGRIDTPARTVDNTTETTIEEFARVFASLYEETKAA